MTDMQPLLIELGTEELPVKALPDLAQAFFDGVIDGLAKRGIAFDRGGAKPLYTPRRLAVLLPGVAPRAARAALRSARPLPQHRPRRRRPADQGAAGLRRQGRRRLDRAGAAPATPRASASSHRAVKPGARTAALLPEIVREALAAMPIPKPMRWGDHDYGFVRPVHWLVMLLGQGRGRRPRCSACAATA